MEGIGEVTVGTTVIRWAIRRQVLAIPPTGTFCTYVVERFALHPLEDAFYQITNKKVFTR